MNLPKLIYIHIFIAPFFIFSGCKDQITASPKPNNLDSLITMKVDFRGHGGFAATYLDSLYRNTEVRISNFKNNDTVIYKIITLKNPAIFSFLEHKQNDFWSRKFIVLPGDTLSFLISQDSTTCIASNPEPTDFDLIYGAKKVTDYFKPVPISDLSKTIDSIENDFRQYETHLKEDAEKHHWRERFLNASILNNSLLKYLFIFKLDYSVIDKKSSNLNILKTQYEKLLKEIAIFEKIHSPHSRILIHYLLQYEMWLKNKSNYDIYSSLFLLDSSLYNKRFFDGYIHDILINDPNVVSLKKKQEILEKLSPILNNKKNILSAQVSSPVDMDSSVLNSQFSDLKNSSHTLKDLLQTSKEMVLIDFWASWCIPCLNELPHLVRFRKKYNGKIKVVSISIDTDKKKWISACEKYKIKENSYLLSNGADNKFARLLKIFSIPRYVLINANKQIIETNLLKPSDKKFDAFIDDILKDKIN